MKIILKIYGFFLRLYPCSFRGEFEEQMLLDFSDLAIDAKEKGRFAFVQFCLRELIALPFSLWIAHWEQGRVSQVLRSQPINFGVRGALGFGIGFAVITLTGMWVSRWLFSVLEPVLTTYSVWYYQTFHNERWIWLLDSLVRLLSYALTGIFFGLSFSLLMGKRRRHGRYFLAGSLTWFIPSLVSHVISNGFGWSFYLKEAQSTALGVSLTVFAGAFWGTSLGFAESDRKVAPRYLVGAVVGYPLVTYLFIRLLFALWLEITPWFFISLMLLMVIFIASVVAVAISIDRKMLWTMAAGAAGCLFLGRVAVYVAYQLLHLPQFPVNTPMPPGDFVVYEISWAAAEAIFGMLLGLLLGLIFGYQRKNISSQLESV